ncbi:MAG: LysE family translocator [Candidatus Malihini olakiniferum]
MYRKTNSTVQEYSRRWGLVGILVHVTYTLIGIGLIIQQSLCLFNIIKLIGAAYLIWLGIKMLRQAHQRTTDIGIASVSDWIALHISFLINVLNPKAMVCIVNLFMRVISPPQMPLVVKIDYGIFISVTHILWFCLVALFSSSSLIRERRSTYAIRST